MRTEDCIRKALGELLPLKYGKSLPAAARDASGSVPVFGSSGVVGQHSSALTTGPTIIVGRKGNVGAVHFSAVPCWPIDTAYFVEPPVGHSATYYRYLLTSLNLVRLDKSTAIPGLSRDDYNAVEVAVHAPAQQLEIVAELEKQFSRLDEAVANLQRVKANLKRYKASVLKAAVEGRLVETEATLARREGRTFETGEQLLQRILEERRAKWSGKGKYKEPAAADAAALGVQPEGWAIASLDMLSTDSGYGTSQKCGYENAGPAVLRIPNVQHGVLDLQDLKFAPTEFKLSQSDAVSSGDMLIIRTNGSKSLIGRAAVVMAEPQRKMSFASYLIRFRLSSAGCIPAWVSVVWQTSQMRQWIEAHAATSAGQHNVSMTVLAKANISVPPVAEQARIVVEVDRHLSIVREVEAEIDTNLQRAQALRQATLAKAFSE
jgi:type I restriction enzyme S subunit